MWRSRVSPIPKLEGVEIATAVLHLLKISIESYNTNLLLSIFFYKILSILYLSILFTTRKNDVNFLRETIDMVVLCTFNKFQVLL